MADDIVTRLRQLGRYVNTEGGRWFEPITTEAADEIERLRAENTKLRGTVLDIDKTGQQLWSMVSASRDSYADETMFLRGEIERLRAELQSYYDEDEEIRRGRSGD